MYSLTKYLPFGALLLDGINTSQLCNVYKEATYTHSIDSRRKPFHYFLRKPEPNSLRHCQDHGEKLPEGTADAAIAAAKLAWDFIKGGKAVGKSVDAESSILSTQV